MEFVPGLELNEGFYRDVVAPLLAEQFPRLNYSAALIGYGSDVLGFDTQISMDHNWGPRLQVFLSAEDLTQHGSAVTEYLRNHLPFAYAGFPTNYCAPRYDQTQSMEETTAYPVNHLIEVTTVERYFANYLGVDSLDRVVPSDWVKLDDQKLLEITSGKVFHDGLNLLVSVRERFTFFPRDAFLLRLARLWGSIEEDEPLVGRTAELNNLDGTKILAARLAETCIKICMYLEGQYLPYRKWLYRAFQTTSVYSEVHPLCMAVLLENDPRRIEDRLCVLYEKIVEIHNRRDDLPRLENRSRFFFNRPYRVIFAETIVEALKNAISDREIAGLV